jgi:hypothetical protein
MHILSLSLKPLLDVKVTKQRVRINIKGKEIFLGKHEHQCGTELWVWIGGCSWAERVWPPALSQQLG